MLLGLGIWKLERLFYDDLETASGPGGLYDWWRYNKAQNSADVHSMISVVMDFGIPKSSTSLNSR